VSSSESGKGSKPGKIEMPEGPGIAAYHAEHPDNWWGEKNRMRADRQSILQYEQQIIRRRRAKHKNGSSSAVPAEGSQPKPVVQSPVGAKPAEDQPGEERRLLDDLTGLALSGGGIRAATFSLGVLQALDRYGIINRLDYLSTVSGGGYIGSSLSATLVKGNGEFAFGSSPQGTSLGAKPSKMLSASELADSDAVGHLRNYSNFLIPKGLGDVLTAAAVVVRGLTANAALILWIPLLLAALTVFSNPTRADLVKSDLFGFTLYWPPVQHFAVTLVFLASAFIYFFVWALLRSAVRAQMLADAVGRAPFYGALVLIAVTLVVIHPLILMATGSEKLAAPESLRDVPLGAVFALLSIGALAMLVVMALWRARLGISYEFWHATHILLALVAVGGGLLHMVGWGFYLADPVKRALWIGMAIFWVALLAYVRIVKPLFMLRRPYRVAAVRHERGDTTTLVMRPEGHAGFRFRPGQFGWLTLWGSPFRITGHPFSFSSSAEALDGRVEMTIRNLGDFTRGIAQVPVGQRVYLDGPYGAFTIGNPADMHVLIAGGIGITPMMSMIRTLADRGDKRPLILLYGGKDWESLTFREELDALAKRIDLTVVYVLSQPPDGWTGERGYIDAALFKRHLPPRYADHEYFICGPDVMMDAIEAALGAMQVPLAKYHSERYSFV